MKIVHIVLLLLLLATLSFAVPASDETFFLKQPDGSTIEARYVGDENFHALVSADGYILQKDALGYYAYVNEKGESSGIYARDAQDRSTTDKDFLAGLDPEAIYQKMIDNTPMEDVPDYGIPKFISPRIQRLPTPKYNLTLGELRGIILLVQFSDVKFKSSNPQKLYTDFMNKEGFSEFAHNGSVRDYYIHNSMGKFTPTFDVYGPITIPGSRESYGNTLTGNKGAKQAMQEALDTLVKRGGIDFSMYDKDKDGFVDFFFMLFAGIGAANSGNKNAIWPHAGNIGNIGNPKNGVKLTVNHDLVLGAILALVACRIELKLVRDNLAPDMLFPDEVRETFGLLQIDHVIQTLAVVAVRKALGHDGIDFDEGKIQTSLLLEEFRHVTLHGNDALEQMTHFPTVLFQALEVRLEVGVQELGAPASRHRDMGEQCVIAVVNSCEGRHIPINRREIDFLDAPSEFCRHKILEVSARLVDDIVALYKRRIAFHGVIHVGIRRRNRPHFFFALQIQSRIITFGI